MDIEPPRSAFPPTRWTVVLQSSASDAAGVQRALTRLCADYWYPLYAFARRMGYDLHDAQDLTQGFFAVVLERDLFALADPQFGRLRTFLLTAFTRYIRDAHRREQALKRGGGREFLQLDVVGGEERYCAELADATTPEKLFERSWAFTVLDTALRQLASGEASAGRAAQFAAARPFLSPATVADSSGAAAAAKLGVTEDALWQLVSRLRSKFREVLRRQIADTLNHPSAAQVEEELSALCAALRA